MVKKKKNEFFEGIRDALREGIEALHRGQKLTMREVSIVSPPKTMSPQEIVTLRKKVLKVSQQVFARLVNVAPQTVQSWEQGQKIVKGGTLRLLRLAQKDPSILLKIIFDDSSPHGPLAKTG